MDKAGLQSVLRSSIGFVAYISLFFGGCAAGVALCGVGIVAVRNGHAAGWLAIPGLFVLAVAVMSCLHLVFEWGTRP